MFVGHFGVALGLKHKAPAVSLGTLFLAAQFIDLLWPTLLLLGVEHVKIAPAAKGPPLHFTHYPVSHNLAMVVVWAVLFGGAVYLLLIHLGNVFGAPPPSVTAVAWVGRAQWLLVLWAYWVDAHRRAKGSGTATPAPV